MSDYTKGPWLREGRTVYALQECDSRVVKYENRFSAGFFAGRGCPEKEAEANAALAAAAPDLLESLFSVIKEYSRYGYVQVETVEMAELAIKKARPGGQK